MNKNTNFLFDIKVCHNPCPRAAQLFFHVGASVVAHAPQLRYQQPAVYLCLVPYLPRCTEPPLEGATYSVTTACRSSFRTMIKICQLTAIALATSGVGAFLSPAIHVGGKASSCRCNVRMAQLDFSASPVNTAETLQRTTELSLEASGKKKKKLALLGSTVRRRKVDNATTATCSSVGPSLSACCIQLVLQIVRKRTCTAIHSFSRFRVDELLFVSPYWSVPAASSTFTSTRFIYLA